MTKEELQKEINALTSDLKHMSSSDSSYSNLWDKRADLKARLRDIEAGEGLDDE